jgi:hypothetical protein
LINPARIGGITCKKNLDEVVQSTAERKANPGESMTFFDYRNAPFPIREDIADAYRTYWENLAAPGSWWSGEQRVAIAQESRNALTCPFCAERKDALSPYTLQGEHRHSGGLPERAIDAVHRVVTDQTRITQSYVDDNAAKGLSQEAYVELVGVVVAVFSIDEFHRALGMPLESLPDAQTGNPSGYRPARLSGEIGFVPTVPIDGAVGNEADLWEQGRGANVLRALSLVPDAVREWRALSAAQYLSLEGMWNYVKDDARSINRMQMELIAGRVSAVNECFY